MLLPGLLGSRLTLAGRSIWGTLRDFYRPHERGAHLGLPHDATSWGPVESPGVIEHIPIVPFVYALPVYNHLIDWLTKNRGYQLGRTLFPFGYDFRRDTVTLVRDLARFVEEVGRRAVASEVVLVGHSHGGILASYLARFGTQDRLGSAGLPASAEPARTVKIRGVIAIGTAFRGALDNLRMMLDGYRPAPLGFHFGPAFHVLARSAVETLPAPGRCCFRDIGGNDAGVDIYDRRAWTRHGLGIFDSRVRQTLPEGQFEALARVLQEGLQRGAKLHAAFAEPLAADAPPHRVIGATRTPTRVSGLLLDVPGVQRWSFDVRYFDGSPHYARGDGEVDAASLSGWRGPELGPVREVPGTHRVLINQPATWTAVGEELAALEAA